jgi:hypothetical protein
MQQYSIAITIYGWTAKNIHTGKILYGEFTDLPKRVSDELTKLLVPSTNSLCVACTVSIPETSDFNLWFRKNSIGLL